MLGLQLIKLQEPQFMADWLTSLNAWANSTPSLQHLMPVLSDIFVFSYPIVLVGLYIYGIMHFSRRFKYNSLYVLFATISVFIINFSIQFLVAKDRPEQFVHSQNHILIKHIPDNSFPSDHAAVAFAFASAMSIWAMSSKNKHIKLLVLLMWIFCIIMCIARIAVWVHWVSDILMWGLIGIICSYIVFKNLDKLKSTMDFLINIEESITWRKTSKNLKNID